MPKISVVMPVYNSEKYLREAIDSILTQTYTDFEFIIIDDGSLDSSAEIVRSYTDPRIRFYINEKNMGVAATLNRGLELATGEYIARMDSDDISLPERFEKQVRYLDAHETVVVCATGIRLFGSQTGVRRFSSSHEQLKVDLLFGCCFAHPTVMLRSSVFRKEGYRYDESYSKMEDYDLWVRISRKHELASIPEILFQYRIHPSQVTQHYNEIYWAQNAALKKRLLRELDLNVDEQAEIFLSGEKGTPDGEKKLKYLELLYQIQLSNREKKIYASAELKSTLRSVMCGILLTLPLGRACSYARICGINPIFYALSRIAKGALQRERANLLRLSRKIKLQHKDFTIISNNCWGGFVYQKYGLPYNTPTIGLFFTGHDYVKFCSRLEHYLSQSIQFIPWEASVLYPDIKDSAPYPVGMIDDIEVYFMHYHSEEEAVEKWERRKQRINWDKMIFKLSQRELCSKQDIEAFVALPYENKICFAYDNVPGAIYVPALQGLMGDEWDIVTPYLNDLQSINDMKVKNRK